VISDFEQCQRVTRELSDLGVLVSIDDFGAGFTSLAHLSGLAINELKLDRVFISGLSGDDSKRTLPLVRATIELGHSLGLRVVAEGIEDEATLALLSDLGCDLGQGYLIGKPTPAGLLALRPQPIVPASAARPGVKAA
jgi:EAL domain-containing protein (putative c-di-GMP-specific phosphodiesterase class I)